MTNDPGTEASLSRKREQFTNWLVARGASILAPTNPYEVLRFTARKGIAIIYRKAQGTLTWNDAATDAWEAYQSRDVGQNWRASPLGKRTKNGKQKSQIVASLLQRDGPECICCGRPTTDDDRTVEHLVPVSSGGRLNLHNLALAHKHCNVRLGNMTLRQKVQLIVVTRLNLHRVRTAKDEPDATDHHEPAAASRPHEDPLPLHVHGRGGDPG